MQASQARSLTCLVCRTHRYAAQAIRRSPLLARHASSEARRQAMIDRIIRVDHAGEVGADRIYAGQMAILGKTSVGSVIQPPSWILGNLDGLVVLKANGVKVVLDLGDVGAGEGCLLGKRVLMVGYVGPRRHNVIQWNEMWDQEKHHRETFERLIPERRVRPTVLLPVWNIAGFVLGASTALLGKEGAMACTVAVEESIGEHYNSQIRELLEDDPEEHAELLKIIKEFRDEELEHLDKGLEHDAEQAPMYSALSNVIKAGCSAAIWLSERI